MKAVFEERIKQMERGEAPKGYKQSYNFCFPEDWELKPLGRIMSPVKKKAGDGEYEALSITAGKGFVTQGEKFGKEIAGRQYSQYTVLKKGDFAYNKGNSKTYPQGCLYLLEDHEEAAVPNVFNSFRLKDKQTISGYYKHLFINGFLNYQLYRLINSGVRNDGLLNLYDDDFYSCILPVPPIIEQVIIAEILTHCDKVIKLKNQFVEEKHRRKKWLMQNLLNPDSDIRLPGYEQKWKIKQLSEICDINKNSLSDVTDRDFEFFYIDITSVNKGKIIVPNNKIKFKEAPVRARKRFCKNDILMSTVRPYLQAFAYVSFNSEEYIASTGFAVLSAKEGISAKFVFHQLFSANLNAQYNNCLVGTNYPALNTSDVTALQVPTPPTIDEQIAIADILSAADLEIDLLEQELAQWQAKKKALMQLLLTGIVRVNI